MQTELLDELKAAHQIIRNALNLMSPTQKRRWSDMNDAAGLVEYGTTRAHEREAVIKKAEKYLKSTCAYLDGGKTPLTQQGAAEGESPGQKVTE